MKIPRRIPWRVVAVCLVATGVFCYVRLARSRGEAPSTIAVAPARPFAAPPAAPATRPGATALLPTGPAASESAPGAAAGANLARRELQPPAPAAAQLPRPSASRASNAVREALVRTTPEALRLHADYLRVRLPVPAEARTLIEMREGGASQEELVDYVRTSFPPGIAVRAIALKWLGVGANAGAGLGLQRTPPAPMGTVIRRDGG